MHNSDKLIIKKVKKILSEYHYYYPKTAADGSLKAPKLSWAPNHPSVNPITLDNQILHNLNAKDYCWSIEHVVKRMRSYGYDLFSAIIHNKYLVMNPLLDREQWLKMDRSPRTFYRKLNSALVIFYQMTPKRILNRLYKMANK